MLMAQFEMVKRVIDEKIIDYIAMDLKAPFEKYEAMVGVPVIARR